jgi:membrane protein YqaA with SNARE-associated domain
MDTLRTQLLAWGLPGLFVIAIIDSAGAPLPGGVDAIVLFLSWRQPSMFALIALSAALGSTIGCWLLYRVGLGGGAAALRRVDPERREWVAGKVRRNGTLAMLAAMLGPPPFPTKLFVLMAGVVHMPWQRFVTVVFLARLGRYLAEAYLAVRLGGRAADAIREHSPLLALLLVGLVAGALLIRRFSLARQAA